MSKIKDRFKNSYEAEFEYDISNRKACSLRCVTCKRWESRIKNSKIFSSKWLSTSATTINKVCVKKHVLSSQHQEAVTLSKKSKLGNVAYKQLVIEKKTPIGQSLKQMCVSDCKSLNVKLNCAY